VSGAASPALSLPRSTAVTDELVADGGPEVPGSVLAEVRQRLRQELVPLVSTLPAGERLTLDVHRLRNPTPDEPDEPFVPSARTCRRAVGLAAVQRCVLGYSPSPRAAVTEVLAAGREEAGRAPWWGAWYGSLTEGGQAVVAAEATTWATQLWSALDWDRFERPPTVGGRDDWWDCPGTKALALHGRVEVRAFAGGRPVMLAVYPGAPAASWRAVMGFPALVAALARGERALPSRVVGLWPASGQARNLAVDASVVEDTAEAVISAVECLTSGSGRKRL
jgi:hypothetical protein